MRTSSILAIAAPLALALASTAAHAQRVSPPPSTDGRPSIACIAACPPTGDVATSSPPNFKACGDKLGQLNRVTVHQIQRVNEERKVHLVPLCDTVNRTLTLEQTAYLERGNIQGLLPAIAGNDLLVARLKRGGYAANDVIGVAVAPNSTILYVSHSR